MEIEGLLLRKWPVGFIDSVKTKFQISFRILDENV